MLIYCHSLIEKNFLNQKRNLLLNQVNQSNLIIDRNFYFSIVSFILLNFVILFCMIMTNEYTYNYANFSINFKKQKVTSENIIIDVSKKNSSIFFYIAILSFILSWIILIGCIIFNYSNYDEKSIIEKINYLFNVFITKDVYQSNFSSNKAQKYRNYLYDSINFFKLQNVFIMITVQGLILLGIVCELIFIIKISSNVNNFRKLINYMKKNKNSDAINIKNKSYLLKFGPEKYQKLSDLKITNSISLYYRYRFIIILFLILFLFIELCGGWNTFQAFLIKNHISLCQKILENIDHMFISNLSVREYFKI